MQQLQMAFNTELKKVNVTVVAVFVSLSLFVNELLLPILKKRNLLTSIYLSFFLFAVNVPSKHAICNMKRMNYDF